MARFTAGLAVAVAAVVGCEPAKELPDAVPIRTASGDGPTVPTASEPAAKAYIDKAVKAFTGGKPELLAKGKVSRTVLKGRIQRPNKLASDVVRTISAVWPDRLADTDRIQSDGKTNAVSAYLHRPHLILIDNGAELSPPNPVEYERNFAADEIAQHWMALLLPATDPSAIVFDFRSTTGIAPDSGKPLLIHLVKLSLGEFPVYDLIFDAATDLLLRVEYSLKAQGVTYRKQWTATNHKTGPDGLTLPRKIEYWQGVLLAEQFEVEKWEFPASIGDAEFAPPKK
jgi:hypothetical protein